MIHLRCHLDQLRVAYVACDVSNVSASQERGVTHVTVSFFLDDAQYVMRHHIQPNRLITPVLTRRRLKFDCEVIVSQVLFVRLSCHRESSNQVNSGDRTALGFNVTTVNLVG